MCGIAGYYGVQKIEPARIAASGRRKRGNEIAAVQHPGDRSDSCRADRDVRESDRGDAG